MATGYVIKTTPDGGFGYYVTLRNQVSAKRGSARVFDSIADAEAHIPVIAKKHSFSSMSFYIIEVETRYSVKSTINTVKGPINV
jgi:hypothetical protein